MWMPSKRSAIHKNAHQSCFSDLTFSPFKYRCYFRQANTDFSAYCVMMFMHMILWEIEFLPWFHSFDFYSFKLVHLEGKTSSSPNQLDIHTSVFSKRLLKGCTRKRKHFRMYYWSEFQLNNNCHHVLLGQIKLYCQVAVTGLMKLTSLPHWLFISLTRMVLGHLHNRL